MNKLKLSELLDDLSVAEQIELVQQIWDNIAESSELPDLTEEERRELDRRSEELRRNPGSGIAWEDVKSQAIGSQRFFLDGRLIHDTALSPSCQGKHEICSIC